MSRKDAELRAYTCELRAEQNEEGGTYIEGRPIVYGKVTDLGYYDEVIEPGALDNADLRDVALLVNHVQDMVPLARSRRNNKNSTMQLMPVDEGLDIRANLDVENNTTAAETYSAIGRGDMSGMSFKFWVNREEWDDLDGDHPTRHIHEIKAVNEVSVVTYPAYRDTYVNEARDAAKALEKARATLESARAKVKAEERKQDIIAKLKEARAK